MRRFNLRILLPLLAAVTLTVGCKDDDPATPGAGLPAGAVPDFALLDVNPTSPSHDDAVSPRDHLQKVSAWYFGHAT